MTKAEAVREVKDEQMMLYTKADVIKIILSIDRIEDAKE